MNDEKDLLRQGGGGYEGKGGFHEGKGGGYEGNGGKGGGNGGKGGGKTALELLFGGRKGGGDGCKGGGKTALELLLERGTLEERSIELPGAKLELLEPSERRTSDSADVLGFLQGLAFGAAIF